MRRSSSRMPSATWLDTLWWSAQQSGLQETRQTQGPTTKASRPGTFGEYIDEAGIDAFCPFGPVLISPRQLSDSAELSVQVILNGETKEVQAQGATLKTVQR